MSNIRMRWIGVIVILFAIAAGGHAAAQSPDVVSLSDNTYSITVSATHKFTRNTEKLKAQATAAASEFCAQQGKQLKIVSMNDHKSMFLVGDMASATITFKALDLIDPELSRPAPIATDAAAGPATGTNEALYANLLRLDDLHKKGILTDEEFAAAKKKELERAH